MIIIRRSLFLFTFLLALLTHGSLYAQVFQNIEIPSSPNPVGSGARALGMGGAFIAVADDATAASWNPGGLIQLEHPEFSFVGSYFSRNEDNSINQDAGFASDQAVSGTSLNYFSLAYPFVLLNRNLVVALSHQYLYDFTRRWEPVLFSNSGTLSVTQSYEIEQKGGLSALGTVGSVQVTPKFSVGMTLNLWRDLLERNGWEQTQQWSGSGTLATNSIIFSGSSKYEYSLSGLNFNLGLLYELTNSATIGAVFKSPFSANLSYESSFTSEMIFPDNPEANTNFTSSISIDETLDMPMSYGLGFSYRFTDNFTMSADIYKTEWQDFVIDNPKGGRISPVTGMSIEESDIGPTWQIRTGAEYLLVLSKYVVPIRGGIFYDPAPAIGRPDDYYGFSLGSGIGEKRVIFDIAYQYRFGDDVGHSALQHMGFSQDVKEHTLFSSVIVYF